jgi:hypothetical protein
MALLGRAGRPRVPRGAWIAVVLLALFVAWTGLSLTWSIAPDRSWAELNRVLAYGLLTVTGVLMGATIPRAVERFATGFLLVVVVVAGWSLGAKIAPGLISGTDTIARLRGPLEYWNALGLLCALAAPIAVRLATDLGRPRAVRLAALEAFLLLAIVVGLTYSRGGVAAFLVGAAVITAFGSGRLRGVIAMGVAIAAAAVPLAFAFSRDGLTVNGAPLGQRIHDGRLLGLVIVLAGLALLAAGAALLRLEPRINWSGERSRRTFRLAAAGAALLIVLGAAGLAHSQKGFGGSINQAVDDFTTVKEDRQFDPVRLVSTNSGNRWSWWKEAAGAWSDHPVAGWGAGSFALLHLRYRHDTLPVTQAHSMPMQLLAETGIVGLLLAYGAVLALLAAAIARTRALVGGRERDLAIALLAGAVAWLAHGFYDWDLQIPAVTAPVLAGLAILAGRPDPRTGEEAVLAVADEPRYGVRAAIVAVTTLLTVGAAISAGLPWLAAEKSESAAEASSSRTPAALEDAAAEADLAARLNPLSTRPLFVAAAVAVARGRLLEARADLLEAVDRAPDDAQAWGRLAALALQLADHEGYARATQRQFQLDPRNPIAERQLSTALQFLALPAGSATATGTPLTAGTPAPVPPPG